MRKHVRCTRLPCKCRIRVCGRLSARTNGTQQVFIKPVPGLITLRKELLVTVKQLVQVVFKTTRKALGRVLR